MMCLGALISLAPWPAYADETYVPRTENELAFAQILDEYRAFNTRLERVAAPLLLKNTELCPRTTRGLGITVHTLSDYQSNLQIFAKVLMGVSDRLSVRSVRRGSPADKAGVKIGDEIYKINDRRFPGGRTVQRFYDIITKTAFREAKVNLSVKRNDEIMSFDISPETSCDYPVNVFFGEAANGHTDGEKVYITSELMRTVPDDVNLALVVAHELAHAIAGHQTKSKALELQADRMALVLMARAGFETQRAIEFWREMAHPHADYQNSSQTHPSITERYEGFNAAQERLDDLAASGTPLTFSD